MSVEKSQTPLSPEARQEGLSEQEKKELDGFASSVQIEEISFEKWSRCHSKLDLEFPVFVSAEAFKLPFKTTVRLSRTIRQKTPNGRIEKREKIEHVLELEPSLEKQRVIVLKGLGDQIDDKVGDLIIIVRVKV